jgi:MFS family permease
MAVNELTARTPSSLWRHPDFLKLWAADSVSQLGSQVTLLALPIVAITVLKATTFQVGLLSAAEMTPFLLVGLPAGAIVDRLRRRPVLIAGDLGRALALASIPIVHAFGALGLAQLYLVAFTTGVLTVFFDVAYMSYLPALVERDQLVEGNSKLEVSRSGGQIAGPGLAGLLIGAFGAAVAMTADAASFVVSAIGITAIRRPEPPPVTAERHRGSFRRDIGDGLRYVFRHRLLRSIAASTATSNLFNSMLYAILILYMVRSLHFRPGLVGLVFACGNVGFLIGALTSSRWVRRLGLGPTIVASAALGGLASLLTPLAPRATAVPYLIASQLLVGVAIPIYNINQVSLRQAICPDRLQGRMNATMRFMVWGTMPLGAVAGGALGRSVGLRPTLWVAAGGGCFAFLWVLLSPVRSLADVPPQEHLDLGEELADAAPGVGGVVGPMAGPAGVVHEPVVGLGIEREGDVVERA